MAPKFTLNLEALEVESFQTAPAGEQDGTVYGHACSDSTCNRFICDCTNGGPQNGTCDVSCLDPCQNTYAGCGSGGTTTDTGTGTDPRTHEASCCTGGQFICSCP